MRDAVRPLFLDGLAKLERRLGGPVTLDHAYATLLTGCAMNGVTLRPAQAPHFEEDLALFRRLLTSDPPVSDQEIRSRSAELNTHRSNKALMLALYPVLNDPHTGLGALGLATIHASLDQTDLRALHMLPAPPEPTHLSEDERRLALLDLWLNDAVLRRALYLPTTPSEWLDASTGARINRTKATFQKLVTDLVGTKWFNLNLRARPGAPSEWGKFLSSVFGFNATANGFHLEGQQAPSGLRGDRMAALRHLHHRPALQPACRRSLPRPPGTSDLRRQDERARPRVRLRVPVPQGAPPPACGEARGRAGLCAAPLRRCRALCRTQRPQQQWRGGAGGMARVEVSGSRRRGARRAGATARSTCCHARRPWKSASTSAASQL